jgi:DNA replication protein DnaC
MSKRATPDVLTDRLRRHLEVLGLRHTAEKLDEHLTWAARDKPPATALLERVLGDEAGHKLQHRIERRLALSGLPERPGLETFDWAFQPKLDKAFILELAGLDFVRRKDDLVITGQSGTGKSHILKSIAVRACQQQMNVRYARCVDLLDDLYAGLADDTYLQRLKRWAAPELLVIDDVGLGQIKRRDNEATAAHMLFNLLDKRHTHASTALTSNLALSAWGTYLGDTTLAAAVLDRLVMHALRIDIDGPSYRQHVASERARKAAARPAAKAGRDTKKE